LRGWNMPKIKPHVCWVKKSNFIKFLLLLSSEPLLLVLFVQSFFRNFYIRLYLIQTNTLMYGNQRSIFKSCCTKIISHIETAPCFLHTFGIDIRTLHDITLFR
jgi:hypothetical protein